LEGDPAGTAVATAVRSADHRIDDHRPVGRGYSLDRRTLDRGEPAHATGRIAHSLHHAWAKVTATLGEDSRDVGELQRRHQQVALPDPQVDRLAGEPHPVFGPFERLAFPLRRRQQTGLLAADVDAGW